MNGLRKMDSRCDNDFGYFRQLTLKLNAFNSVMADILLVRFGGQDRDGGEDGELSALVRTIVTEGRLRDA